MNELLDSNFDAQVIAAPIPVLVDFHAPWCGPCRMLAPLLETLADQYRGRIEFVKVNIDAAPELAARYAIQAVPTLMLFHQGEPLDTLVGMVSSNAIKSRLDSLLASLPIASVSP